MRLRLIKEGHKEGCIKSIQHYFNIADKRATLLKRSFLDEVLQGVLIVHCSTRTEATGNVNLLNYG